MSEDVEKAAEAIRQLAAKRGSLLSRKTSTEMAEAVLEVVGLAEGGFRQISYERYYLLSQIEAHFGRMLRQSILINADLDFVREQYADGIPLSTWEAVMGALIEEATRAGEALDAAYRCPKELLPSFKNWLTNEAWRDQMIEAGYRFDVEKMIWQEP